MGHPGWALKVFWREKLERKKKKRKTTFKNKSKLAWWRRGLWMLEVGRYTNVGQGEFIYFLRGLLCMGPLPRKPKRCPVWYGLGWACDTWAWLFLGCEAWQCDQSLHPVWASQGSYLGGPPAVTDIRPWRNCLQVSIREAGNQTGPVGDRKPLSSQRESPRRIFCCQGCTGHGLSLLEDSGRICIITLKTATHVK